MLTINTNTTSLTTQMNLSKSNSLVKTSIERMSTGFKINRASDDAANMSISKSMNCQISGTEVALENSQQAINLLQTADGALDNMQDNLQRIRELTVEALNGTYSSEEKQMIQQEVNQLLEETYKQKNNTYYNEIKIFGEDEEVPEPTVVDPTKATPGMVEITRLTEEEAIAQGYTCIHNAEEFANMAQEEFGRDFVVGKFCLMGDIDFSQVSGWSDCTTLGGLDSAELNGNGYSINNYTSTSGGLFYSSQGGTIKNLSMKNVNINSTDNVGALVQTCEGSGSIDNCSVSGNVTGGDYTGGLVGYNSGTITNCSSSATVTGTGDNTGGLVGDNNGTISDCSSSATVTGTGDNTGGLIGYNVEGTITNCSSSGTVTGVKSTGGLVGTNGDIAVFAFGGQIINCSSSAIVAGTGDNTAGLIGTSFYATITDCSSSGIVTGSNYTGGLVGYNADVTVTDCSSSGSITGSNYTGGLVGGGFDGEITDCSSSGNVTGSRYTGGLVGYSQLGTIDKSYATGDVSGTDYVGGIIGKSDGTISNSYALGNVSGTDNVGGAVGETADDYCRSSIGNSYSTGTVTGTGSNIGGFVANTGSYTSISNSYTSSELDFYYSNNGTISNCHGTTEQTGVTAHDASWFEDGANLSSVLGSAFDTSIIPPDIIGNERPVEEETGTVFQIGANSGEENTITVETAFSMGGYYADVTTVEAGQKTLVDTDNILNKISSERSKIGAMQNRLESVTSSLSTRENNLEASHSTIVDTDYAAESSKLVKNQILQNVASSLLAQANTTPEIALQLLT